MSTTEFDSDIPELHAVFRAAADRVIPADEWPAASGAGALAYFADYIAGPGATTWTDLLEPYYEQAEWEVGVLAFRTASGLAAGA
jgi:hypothetical protein